MMEKKNHMFRSLLALWIGWVFASWMHIFAGACMMYAYVKLAQVTTIMLVGIFSIPIRLCPCNKATCSVAMHEYIF